MKIKANEKLFFEIYRYASRITKMAIVIQKDNEITQEEYKQWARTGLKNLDDIKNWIKQVGDHIKGCE